MIVYELKVRAKQLQYQAIDEAIRIGQFIQNNCLRYWIDNKSVNKYDINKQCAILAKEFDFANKLNSMARQSDLGVSMVISDSEQDARTTWL